MRQIETQDSEEISCKDCKYYIPHYAKVDCSYVALLDGHCVNRKENGRFRKTNKICECFERKDKEAEKKKQRQRVEHYLGPVLDVLHGLEEILKE